MDQKNQKEVKEMNKNTSKEKMLRVLQTRHHLLQPNLVCAICKRSIEGKQVVPIYRGNIQCKRIHNTDGSKKKSICTVAKNKESVLAKMKFMTGEQMHILNKDIFNQEVERLKRRVGQAECTKTHEEIAKTSLKVSKLEKEEKAVLPAQEETSPPGPAPREAPSERD